MEAIFSIVPRHLGHIGPQQEELRRVEKPLPDQPLPPKPWLDELRILWSDGIHVVSIHGTS
jgi:hypothetical protein